ncbi:MAG TPA: tRNA modification GTPase [Pirellulales bacterium]|nr:tRNA modification GTPase [Pirellulales bacterium]
MFSGSLVHSPDDTIAAIATAAGGSARGILRISGHEAVAVVRRVFTPHDLDSLESASRACVIAGSVALSAAVGRQSASSTLPCTLYLWPTIRSFTREPVAELHTFGSPPLLAILLRAVCSAGARLAEPGEFTLRAFLAGRLDLIQAEAVLGVIDANDRRQLGVALSQLAGGLSGPLASLRDELLNLLADLEAGLDFADEGLQFISDTALRSRLAAATERVEQLLDRMRSRNRVEIEPRVALVGWPNVGKSSLFNALLDRTAAIVSSEPGTTRDYLMATLPLGETSCRLVDTAGREPIDVDHPTISSAAQQMTVEQTEQADLRLLCLDATREPNAWEQTQLTTAEHPLVALTKCDAVQTSLSRTIVPRAPGRLPTTSPLDRILPTFPGSAQPPNSKTHFFPTSALTGVGLDALKAAIREQLASQDSNCAVANTATRCNESLRLAAECLRRAGQMASRSGGEELIAAELRAALVELGTVVGTVYTDDILDRVFSRFCIGK